jgi:hypothetical protein
MTPRPSPGATTLSNWRAITLWMICAMAALGLTQVTSAAPRSAVPQQPPTSNCPGVDGLDFLCGITNAEDLVVIPGTHWIVASGLGARDGIGPPGALRVIDGHSLRWWQAYPTWRQWYPADPSNAAWDRAQFPNCPGRPDPLTMVAHGIGVRRLADRTFMIYMVNHQKDERIDAFKVFMGQAGPALTWVGCVEVPPPYITNAVSAAPDGTIYATVLRDPGKTLEDIRRGDNTGAIYQWTPGTPAFVRLPLGQWNRNLARRPDALCRGVREEADCRLQHTRSVEAGGHCTARRILARQRSLG